MGRLRISIVSIVTISFFLAQTLRPPFPFRPNNHDNGKNIDKSKAVPKDGLMVLAFFYEKILFGRETVNLTAAGFSQYADEGSVLHEGKNMTMFEAVRALRHNVNPNFDVGEDGIWSNMEWDNFGIFRFFFVNPFAPTCAKWHMGTFYELVPRMDL